MSNAFSGFSPKAITFLRQLEKNNTREWFQPRKEQFDELLRLPMLELTGIIADQLRTFAIDHVIEPKKAMNRIYRDVRFSKDKSPYKTNISALFPARGFGKTAGSGYYISLSAKAFELACGMYLPGPPELAAIRAEIDKNPAGFRKVIENPKMVRISGPLHGEQLARPPKGFAPDHAAIDLLRRKQFYFYVTLPTLAATSPGLDKLIIKHMKAMSPAVELLNTIVRKATKQDDADEERPLRPKPMF